MRKQRNDDTSWDVTGRIKSLEMFTGALVARPAGEGGSHAADGAGEIPIHEAAPTRVPEPRRSRIFLRSGAGLHGAFAELTVTAPQPRTALD